MLLLLSLAAAATTATTAVPPRLGASLAACGIQPSEISRIDEPESEYGFIHVSASAPSEEQLACAARASLAEGIELRFDDPVQQRYRSIEHRLEAGRVRSRAWFARRGLLARLPAYDAKAADLVGHARRLERLCGVRPGSLLTVLDGTLTVNRDAFASGFRADPKPPRGFECIENAVSASGIDLYFVGNEAYAPAAGPAPKP